MRRDFQPIIFAREIIFVITTIILVVFSFRIRSDVDNLKELKIKTNFNLDNKIDEELNNFDFSYFNDELNQVEKFFKRYNLTEGQTFSDNKIINDLYNHFSRTSLALIILTIITACLPCPCTFLAAICNFDVTGDDDGDKYACHKSIIFFLILRTIIICVCLFIYVGFYVEYKKEFENDFFDFSNNTIKGEYLKKSFDNYYIDLFNLNTHLFVNIIVLSVVLFLLFANNIYAIIWCFKGCDLDDYYI